MRHVSDFAETEEHVLDTRSGVRFPAFQVLLPNLDHLKRKMQQTEQSHQPSSIQKPSPGDLSLETVAFAAKMFDAARNGDETLLTAAVDAGLPVNLTNHQGNTLLMLAAYAGHMSLSKALLSRGADPDRLNDQGQSIIAGTVFKNHHDLVKLLIDSKADVRLGKPNAIESVWMFTKEEAVDGKIGRDELLKLMGAKDEDKERLDREGVRVGPPVGHP